MLPNCLSNIFSFGRAAREKITNIDDVSFQTHFGIFVDVVHRNNYTFGMLKQNWVRYVVFVRKFWVSKFDPFSHDWSELGSNIKINDTIELVVPKDSHGTTLFDLDLTLVCA